MKYKYANKQRKNDKNKDFNNPPIIDDKKSRKV